MRILDGPNFDQFNNSFSQTLEGFALDCRVEVYSCKMTNDEKHFVRKKQSSLNGSFSPPSKFCYTTAHSPQSEDQYGIGISAAPKPNPVTQSDAKTICHFIQALNASYPDYDFSDSLASDFAQETDVATVRVYIDDLLGKSLKHVYFSECDDFWKEIDANIGLGVSEVYSYNCEKISTPFADDDCIWSFGYFFFNRGIKRLLFFACRALREQALDMPQTLNDDIAQTLMKNLLEPAEN